MSAIEFKMVILIVAIILVLIRFIVSIIRRKIVLYQIGYFISKCWYDGNLKYEDFEFIRKEFYCNKRKNKNITVSETCINYLYNRYLLECYETLCNIVDTKNYDRYINTLKKVNTKRKFIKSDIKDLEDIICMTDKELRTEKEIIKINKNRIKEFIECHKDEFDQTVIPIDRLTKKMNNFVIGSEFLSENKIKKIFYKQIKKIGFKYEYEKFLNENLKEEDAKYCDKLQLFKEIKNSDEYKKYTGLKNIVFDNFWMRKYLIGNIANNK